MSIQIPPKGLMGAAMVAIGMQVAVAADMDPSSMGMKESALSTADQRMVRSAMTAAPRKVSANATVVAMDANGQMRTLREGSNGFTCMPDNPATPGPDPMCMDKAALEWAHAWMGRTEPANGQIGFMYMLSGGSDASNTDPYASKPDVDNNWIKTGPHVMIVGADASFYDMYPQNADPDTSAPYVMWPGTPYQHLMIPVR